MKTGIYILKSSHIDAIRDCIIDNNLSDGDSAFLNSADFKKIIVDYKDKYGVGMTAPYTLMGITLEEDTDDTVPQGTIKVIKYDTTTADNQIVEEYKDGI